MSPSRYLDPESSSRLVAENWFRKEPWSNTLATLKEAAEEEAVELLAAKVGLPYVRLGREPIQERAAATKGWTVSRQSRAVAVGEEDGKLVIAVAEPPDSKALQAIKDFYGDDIRIALASPSAIDRFMEWPGWEAVPVLEELLAVQQPSPATQRLQEVCGSSPLHRFLGLLLGEAREAGASSIHVEPHESRVRVRWRIDGQLRTWRDLPKVVQPVLVVGLKRMSCLDLSEERLAQDGRVRLRPSGGPSLDVRVSVVPSIFGESLVLTLVDPSPTRKSLDDLGLDAESLVRFRNVLRMRRGLILVVGPDGAGRRTTINAALRELDPDRRKIMTVEDSVDQVIEGVTQIQSRPALGMTTAACLRTIRRQDADVFVSDAKDYETSEILCRMVLQGRLGLTRLHVGSTAEAIARLLDMGIESFWLSELIVLIQSQRLVRTLCTDCKGRRTLSRAEVGGLRIHREQLRKLGLGHLDPDRLEICEPAGCDRCSQTGYSGRALILEQLEMKPEIREAIRNGTSQVEIFRLARRLGMESLGESALRKVLLGETSLEEYGALAVMPGTFAD